MPQGGFIYFSVTGLDTTLRRIPTWGLNISTLAPAWSLIAEDLRADARQQFTNQGGFFGAGSRWDPLRPSTVADRERKGYFGPSPIEFRTGYLYSSITQKGGPGNVEVITPNSLTIGSTYPIAGYQHYGTARMPARQLLGINWQRQSLIVRRVGDYVMNEARRVGLDAHG